MNRRDFIKTSTAAAAAAMFSPAPGRAADFNFKFYIFSKHLQWLGYDEAALLAKAAGCDGLDLTVRPGGHVLPEKVEDDLPRAATAVRNAGLETPMMVTAITKANQQAETILKTASELGIRYYRMGYLSYDDDKGIIGSLNNLKPQMQELADLNRQYNIKGCYQNHAGTRIGAAIWDLYWLLNDIDPDYLGLQYDIKHATAEGGRSWEVDLKLVAPMIHTIVLKDFKWMQRDDGSWRDAPVPLGTGMVNFDRYFEMLKSLKIEAPISLHLEYPLPHQLDLAMDKKKEREAEMIRNDVQTAKTLLAKQGLI